MLEAVDLACPLGGGDRVEVEQEGQVGDEPAGGELVDLRDLVDPKAASAALVGQRGIEEAVGDDDPPGLERGPDDLLDELGARRGEQQRLGRGVIGTAGSLSRSRRRSPASLPPGSRTPSASSPSGALPRL